MPALEDALVSSAGGDFGLILLAFLILTLVGCFLWAMKKILDQNATFNADIIRKMDDIVQGMKEYKSDTCAALEKHDQQAKEIMRDVSKIQNTMENRAYPNGGK
jgi:hypothetical protein